MQENNHLTAATHRTALRWLVEKKKKNRPARNVSIVTVWVLWDVGQSSYSNHLKQR